MAAFNSAGDPRPTNNLPLTGRGDPRPNVSSTASDPRAATASPARSAPTHQAVPAPPHNTSTVPPHAAPIWTVPTTDLGIVTAIANVMQCPPSVIDQYYADGASWVAQFLGVPIAELGGSSSSSPFRARNTRGQPQYNVIIPRSWESDERRRDRALAAQGNVLALIERVRDFADKAHSAGFSPPDNPFVVIAGINSQRSPPFAGISVSAQLASDLVFNVKAYVDLLEAFNQGGIDLARGEFNAAQLSHVRLSFDGLGGSGNPAVDIKVLLPSLDAQKREAAARALQALDFSKRVPSLLFTLDYRPEMSKGSVGTILGFRRIPDASGYLIKRRDVFIARDREIQIDNASISPITAQLLPYAKAYALGFFDKIDEGSVLLFLDTDVSSDEYYIYRVQAYQTRNDNQAATFSVDSLPVALTPVAKQSIGQLIRKMSNWPDFTIVGYDSSGSPIKSYNNFQETISPWPAFSQYLYGDSSYDWMLAAVNVRASINRRDDRATTRKYSYLSAHSQFLEAQSDAGKLVKPADIGAVVRGVNDSVQRFGVSQTIQNILDETGVSYYIDGRDPAEDSAFNRAGQLTTGTTRLFDSVAAAIDPETATLDVKQLASNMAALLNQQLLDVQGTSLLPPRTSPTNNSPTEISVPSPDDSTPSVAEGPLQFINRLGDMQDGIIDLTSFEGLSRLMRAVRIISDFGPDRIPPVVAPADVQRPVTRPG